MNTPIISVRDVHESYGRRTSAGRADDGSSCVQKLVRNRLRRRFRVLICDNDEVYRIGLRTVLKSLPEIVVVGETAEAARALELSEVFAPQIALVSSELGGAALLLVEAL